MESPIVRAFNIVLSFHSNEVGAALSLVTVAFSGPQSRSTCQNRAFPAILSGPAEKAWNAEIAQWQSTAFVKRGLWVQLPFSAFSLITK